MVSEKRRRELARAKWDRQRARRAAAARRAHTMRVIGGITAGVVALVLVGLGVRALVGAGSNTPTIPTENTLTFRSPPPNTDDTEPSSATSPTTGSPTTGSPTTGSKSTTGTKSTDAPTDRTPTAPVTASTTGSGTP